MMDRRTVLQLLASSIATVPALASCSPTRQLALAGELHSRVTEGRGPRALDAHQNRTVLRIAELILPETDTPGARTVRVNEFIDLLLAESFADRDRDRFLHGLSAIDDRCRRQHGAEFTAIAQAQQIDFLKQLDASAIAEKQNGAVGAANDRNVPAGAEYAFAVLKKLTLFGYFTSEVVMKHVLRVTVILGRFDGCVAVTPI